MTFKLKEITQGPPTNYICKNIELFIKLDLQYNVS